MKKQKIAKVKILNIKICKVTNQDVLILIENYIKSRKPHQIVTVNPEFIVGAQKDREFAQVLNGADLAVADGYGIILACKLLKKTLPERISGTELIYQIAPLACQKGWRIFLLGGKEGIASKTYQILKKNYPKIKIVGQVAGNPHDLTIIQQIKKAKPDILYVAWGAPKQDKWIAKFKQSLGVPVMMGVGGAFDYISKQVPRAPEWMRKAGLEWLYRLIRQPWRWRRIYTAVIKFPIAILSQSSKKKPS